MRIGYFSKNRILACTLVFVMAVLSVSCSAKKEDSRNKVEIYYLNSDETGIVSKEHELAADPNDTHAVVMELVEELKKSPSKSIYGAPISEDVLLLSDPQVIDGVIEFNFGSQYFALGRTTEILSRAAIVRTFTQVKGIDYVSFSVDGSPLTENFNPKGKPIGNMSADTFIYNVGSEINTYEKIELKLYFANENGDKLIPVYRSVVYNSNISIEKLAVEQIISGPNTSVVNPTISKDTKVNSVTIKDGTCYIDFDSAFLNPTNNVSAEVTLYSIVNTVVEFPDVNKVSISIDGNSSFKLLDFTITGAYEKNLDIVMQ
ncbi:MAG: GerMN domain-containing protein [Butyrivibrio sp.]|nr:GerMN domain-containing protein [Butyrivibrio sp.]